MRVGLSLRKVSDTERKFEVPIVASLDICPPSLNGRSLQLRSVLGKTLSYYHMLHDEIK